VKCTALVPIIWLLAAPTAFAETLYVTDQVTVGLRADVTPNAAVLGTVSTGAALEVLERNGALVRVRVANGVEGWVEETALTSKPPAAQQLKSLHTELDRVRTQLANAQGELEKMRAAPKPDAGKTEADLAAARAQIVKLQGEVKKKDEEISASAAARDAATAARDLAVKEAASLRSAVAREAAREATAPTAPEAPQPAESPKKFSFSFIWLGIAFAMLVVGFIGGIVWVKESIRRRMGGMYLRV
jgi:SH3 domain protein